MNPEPKPIISPIAALLKSRKFILAFVGVALDLIIALVPPDIAPRIAPMREELLLAVTGLIFAVIGGITVEDHAEKSAPTTIAVGQAENVTAPVAPSQPPPKH